MKKMYFFGAFICFLLLASSVFGAANLSAEKTNVAAAENTAVSAVEKAKEEWSEMSRKEKRAKKKEIKKALKEAVKNGSSDAETLLLVIIAILLPPLAMALYDGISNRFWISLLLTLLFFIPGMIYTLVIILGGN